MPRAKYTKRPDGRYQTKVYVGIENDKPKYKSSYAATVSELERKADELRYQLHKGGGVLSGDLPFSTWAERFLRLKENKVSPAYYSGIRSRINYWRDVVGDLPLSKITRSDLQVHLVAPAQKSPGTGSTLESAS